MTVRLIEKRKIQKSNNRALLEKYQYLVEKTASKFENIPQSRENLEEVGYIGLLNAANLYDYSVHKIKFKDYAQILITKEIHQYLNNRNHEIDRPDWLIRLNDKIDQFVINYRQLHQKYPQITDIAKHLNISNPGLYEVLKARNSLIDMERLQPEIHKIRSQSYQSFKLPIEDIVALKKGFNKLKKLQENIIYCLFFMDLKQTKLSKILGIPIHKIDQMKKEAFQSLGL